MIGPVNVEITGLTEVTKNNKKNTSKTVLACASRRAGGLTTQVGVRTVPLSGSHKSELQVAGWAHNEVT